MPDFDVTSPDGKTFRVSAPEGATQEQALAYAKRNMPKADPEPSFPYDKPGTTYGDVLPLARDEKTGATSLAVPEMIRSPLRGAISMGKRIMGEGPAETQGNLTDEELGTVMAVGGRPSPRVGAPGVRGAGPPPTISPERAALAKEAMETFKIPITAPQIGTNKTTKFIEDTLRHVPMSGAGGEALATQQAFNRAVSKTFGEDAPAITQTVMDQAKRRIGNKINSIEEANPVKLDDNFVNDLAEIEQRAQSSLTEQEFGVIKRQMNDALKNISADDTLEGKTYGNLLRHNSALDNAVNHDNTNIARVAGEVKGALQDALERSLSGEDLAAYRGARFQYKNMKTIEPLVNKSPEGNISPALLNGRVTSQFANRAFDTGSNPLDRLAKIGQAFLKEPATSGSSERGAAALALGKIGGAVAGGTALTSLPGAVVGTGAALLAGRMAGNYLRSPGLARRTIDRGLNPPQGPMDYGVGASPPVGLAVGDALNESPDPAKRALGAQ